MGDTHNALAAAPALDGEVSESTDGSSEQERKLFLGGLSWETTDAKLREHFGQYGSLTDVVIMTDKVTGRSRGFGFVTYASKQAAEDAVTAPHTIDGKQVEAKRAQSREAMGGGSSSSDSYRKIKKVFVGGLDPATTEQEFRECFEKCGPVVETLIMKDGTTGKPRGFGFVTFEDEAGAQECTKVDRHRLHGRDVQVKLAVPKEQMGPPPRRGPMGGGPMRGGPMRGGYDGGGYGGGGYGGYGGGYGGGGYGGGGYGGYGGGGGGGGYGGGGYGGGYGGALSSHTLFSRHVDVVLRWQIILILALPAGGYGPPPGGGYGGYGGPPAGPGGYAGGYDYGPPSGGGYGGKLAPVSSVWMARVLVLPFTSCTLWSLWWLCRWIRSSARGWLRPSCCWRAVQCAGRLRQHRLRPASATMARRWLRLRSWRLRSPCCWRGWRLWDERWDY